MFLVAVILLAIVVGYIRKGSLSNVVKAEIRVPYLFVLALLLFLVVEAGNAAGWEVIMEYSIWIRFLAHFTLITSIFVNIQTLDIWPLAILIGSVMNFTAIFSNVGRMPVSARALEIAGIETAVIEASNYFELAGASTSFSFLGGVIPIPLPGIFAQVISIGTLLIAFGAFGFIQELMLGIEYIDEDEALDAHEKVQTGQTEEPVTVEVVEPVASVEIAEPVEDVDPSESEEEVPQQSDAEESEDDIKAAILGAIAEEAVMESELDEEYDDFEDDIDDYDDYDGYFDDELDYEDEKFGDLFKEIDEQLAEMGRIEEEPPVEDIVTDEYAVADTYESQEVVSAEVEPQVQIEGITEDTTDEDILTETQQEEIISDDTNEPVDEIDILIEGLSEDDFDDAVFDDDLFGEYEDIYLEDMDFDDIEEIHITEDIEEINFIDEPEAEVVKRAEEVMPEDSENTIAQEDESSDEVTMDDAENFADEETDEPAEDVSVNNELVSEAETVIAEDTEELIEDGIDDAEMTEELPEETTTEEVSVDTTDIVDAEEFVEDAVSEVIQEELITEVEPTDQEDELAENIASEDVVVEQVEESYTEDIKEIFEEDIPVEEPEFIIEGLDDFEDVYSVVEDDDDILSDPFDGLFNETEEDSGIGSPQEDPADVAADDSGAGVVEDVLSDEPEVFVGEQFVDTKSHEEDEPSAETDETDEDLEAIFRAILSTEDELISETILSSGEEESLIDDVVTLEYANAASFFEDLDRNEVKEQHREEEDIFEKLLADDAKGSVSEQIEEVIEQIKADEEDGTFDLLKSVGKTVESVSNELQLEPQSREQAVLPQTDSQYIVIDGKIVENPNYKLRRSSRTRFATEEEKLFGDISSGRRRNKSSNKGKFSIKEDE